MEPADSFLRFAAELADGERWKLIQADGWDDFQERLAGAIGELPVRRRQALMMLLLSMTDETVTAEQVRDWFAFHDADSDRGVEELIGWLRERRSERRGPQ